MHVRLMRWLFNCYPPFLGAGIRVARIAPDWRYVRVELPLRWYNRNYVGTHFGGCLFAMADPFLMIMAMRNLGAGYRVWDRTAQIEFVAPGRGRVAVEFTLTEADLARMRDETETGASYEPWFDADIRAADGTLVARVRKQLYVRRSPRTPHMSGGKC
jgi:acyl-coenzyme A thioesterase PaaI-like protein